MRRARRLALVPLLAACGAPPSPGLIESAPAPGVEASPLPVETRDAPLPAAATPAAPDAPPDPAAEATLALPIPARDQSAAAPPEGWCGETAIQEGLLNLGVWAPQQLINRAGRPAHPDLYSSDIPVALAELGVRHVFYQARKPGFPAFAAWAKATLEEGDAVIAGVKILPTEHPGWALDHFVLVVGHGRKGLLVNTTWGSQAWVADDERGLSFKNAFYGIRLRGLRLAKGARPARITVLEEGVDTIDVRVSCAGLTSGEPYRLERRRSAAEARPEQSDTLTAVSGRVEKDLRLDVDLPAQFQCLAGR